MAKTKYHPNAELTSGEIHLTLYPRQHDIWRGSAEQLTDAGLIPEDFKWPSRSQRRSFTHRGIQCALERTRLPGMGRQPWVTVDYWCLTRYCAGRGNGGAELFAKQEALRQELWKRSAEGNLMFRRLWTARSDIAFQSFKQRAIGLVSN
jgi:hypothetical protein